MSDYVKREDVAEMLRMEDWPGTTRDDLAALPGVDVAALLAERDAARAALRECLREYDRNRRGPMGTTNAALAALLAHGAQVDG